MIFFFLFVILRTYIFEELLAKEWEATKQMGDAIEANEEEEIYLNMNDCDSRCPLECELPLRWGLLCRHWMYPAFVNESPIPLSLIHSRWFFDGPDSLEQPWTMSYSHNQEFTYAFLPHATTNSPPALDLDLPQNVMDTDA